MKKQKNPVPPRPDPKRTQARAPETTSSSLYPPDRGEERGVPPSSAKDGGDSLDEQLARSAEPEDDFSGIA